MIFSYSNRELGCWYRYGDEVHLTLNLIYPDEGLEKHMFDKEKELEKTVCGQVLPVSREVIKSSEEKSVEKCEVCMRAIYLEELKE